MALSKPNSDFYGFTTDVYAKVSQVLVTETGADEAGKTYQAKLAVNWYTNASKSHHFSQTEETVSNLREPELSLASLYSKLKESEKFAGFVDA